MQIRIQRDKNDVVTSVADTGSGISSKDIDRLFQPFEQLDGTIRRRHSGSGLGLSISKGFVELHGGKMWIESVLGQGTTVLFRLPITPSEPFQTAATGWLHPEWEYRQRTRPTTAISAPTRPRLVIVERGGTLKRLLARYEDSAEVVVSSSLEQAAADLAETPAHTLLVNDTDVAQTLQRITARGTPPGIPVIVCAVPDVPEAIHALRGDGLPGQARLAGKLVGSA